MQAQILAWERGALKWVYRIRLVVSMVTFCCPPPEFELHITRMPWDQPESITFPNDSPAPLPSRPPPASLSLPHPSPPLFHDILLCRCILPHISLARRSAVWMSW